MTDRGRSQTGLSGPLGGGASILALIACAAAAVILALSARTAVRVEPPGAGLENVLSPARGVVVAPFRAVRRATTSLSRHMDVYRENERLREENARLRDWYAQAQVMRDKMGRYEQLLAASPETASHVAAGRVVAETSGPFVRARVLDVGANAGVDVGYAVMSERGMVGRVVASAPRASRVLMLTDLNSRIPVLSERTDVRGILAGDNAGAPRLLHLPPGHGLEDGDRIVTSGDAGEIPRGLPVGVAELNARGEWRVRLFSQERPLDYVRVVGFSDAPEDRLDEPRGGDEADGADGPLDVIGALTGDERATP